MHVALLSFYLMIVNTELHSQKCLHQKKHLNNCIILKLSIPYEKLSIIYAFSLLFLLLIYNHIYKKRTLEMLRHVPLEDGHASLWLWKFFGVGAMKLLMCCLNCQKDGHPAISTSYRSYINHLQSP